MSLKTALPMLVAVWSVGCTTAAPSVRPPSGPVPSSAGHATATASPSEAQLASWTVIASGDHVQVGAAARYATGWIVAGSVDGKPAIWRSDDGRSWTREQVLALATRGGHLTDVAMDGERVVISGWGSSRLGGGATDQPLIVAGSPGDVWQVVDHLPLPAGVGGLLTSVAVGGSLTVAGGSLGDGTAAVWTSASDGVDWEGPIAVPADRGSSIASLLFDRTEFVAVGETVGGQSGAATWRSSDGVTWSADPPMLGSFADATVFDGSVVAVGHDATSATIHRLSGGREPLPAPESADLTSVASDGSALAAASASTAGEPVWLRVGDGWQTIDLGVGASVAVRSLAIADGFLLVAGDDGSAISVAIIELAPA